MNKNLGHTPITPPSVKMGMPGGKPVDTTKGSKGTANSPHNGTSGS